MAVAVSIVGTLLVLSMLLVLTDLAERKVVSEPVLIARVVKAPRLTPEDVEAFVTHRAQRVLRDVD